MLKRKRAVPVFIALALLISSCGDNGASTPTAPPTSTPPATSTAMPFEVVTPQELINRVYYNEENLVGKIFQITITAEEIALGDDFAWVVSEQYKWVEGSPVWFDFNISGKPKSLSKGTQITVRGTLNDLGAVLHMGKAGVMFFFKDCVIISTK